MRPDHRMIGHTGFLLTARRLAPGAVLPRAQATRRRSPTTATRTSSSGRPVPSASGARATRSCGSQAGPSRASAATARPTRSDASRGRRRPSVGPSQQVELSRSLSGCGESKEGFVRKTPALVVAAAPADDPDRLHGLRRADLGGCDRLQSGTASELVTANGSVGSAPERRLPDSAGRRTPPRSTQVDAGDGDADAGRRQIVDLQLSLYDGETGDRADRVELRRGQPVRRTAGDPSRRLRRPPCECATVGSRVVAATTVADVYGADTLDPQPGPRERRHPRRRHRRVRTPTSARPTASDQLPQDGMPAVVTAPDGSPGITIPDDRPARPTCGSRPSRRATARPSKTATASSCTSPAWTGRPERGRSDRTWPTKAPITRHRDHASTKTRKPVSPQAGRRRRSSAQRSARRCIAVIPPDHGFPDGAAPSSVPPGIDHRLRRRRPRDRITAQTTTRSTRPDARQRMHVVPQVARVPSRSGSSASCSRCWRRETGLTKNEILSTVQGYRQRYSAGGDNANLERQFERDKDDIRDLGVPLETVESPGDAGNNQNLRYRIPRGAYELPADITFSPEETTLLNLAAMVWREGSLSGESRRALLKLRSLGVDRRRAGARLRAARAGARRGLRAAQRGARASTSIVRFPYLKPGEADAPASARCSRSPSCSTRAAGTSPPRRPTSGAHKTVPAAPHRRPGGCHGESRSTRAPGDHTAAALAGLDAGLGAQRRRGRGAARDRMPRPACGNAAAPRSGRRPGALRLHFVDLEHPRRRARRLRPRGARARRRPSLRDAGASSRLIDSRREAPWLTARSPARPGARQARLPARRSCRS